VREFRQQIGGGRSDTRRSFSEHRIGSIETGQSVLGTGRREKPGMTLWAGQSANVTPDKLLGADVISTCTENPRSISARANSAAL